MNVKTCKNFILSCWQPELLIFQGGKWSQKIPRERRVAQGGGGGRYVADLLFALALGVERVFRYFQEFFYQFSTTFFSSFACCPGQDCRLTVVRNFLLYYFVLYFIHHFIKLELINDC